MNAENVFFNKIANKILKLKRKQEKVFQILRK